MLDITEKQRKLAPDRTNLTELKILNQMIAVKQPGFITVVNDFHLKYIQQKLLAKGCNPDICYPILEEAYELARGYMLHKTSLLELNIEAEFNFVKRWGFRAEIMQFHNWLSYARYGDMFQLPQGFDIKYFNAILQAFSNCTYHPIDVSVGATDVSVGFVDLSSLIYSDLQIHHNNELAREISNVTPFK
jgi:hypothetical protein